MKRNSIAQPPPKLVRPQRKLRRPTARDRSTIGYAADKRDERARQDRKESPTGVMSEDDPADRNTKRVADGPAATQQPRCTQLPHPSPFEVTIAISYPSYTAVIRSCMDTHNHYLCLFLLLFFSCITVFYIAISINTTNTITVLPFMALLPHFFAYLLIINNLFYIHMYNTLYTSIYP